jgi:amino acid adenylation domain-containing protein/non-ribosomal peptide synthase protein (TIGR01720 family)
VAAFQVVLSRYSGQEDICVGTPIANRNRKETEGLIGFFINTLVLRTDLTGSPTVREVLRRVRETALGAYAHQEVAFEKLVEELQPERSLSHEPLFQVMFTFQKVTEAGSMLAGMRIEGIAIEVEVAKFDLGLAMVEAEGEIIARLEYATQLYDRSRIERMGGHLVRVLEEMAGEVGIGVGEIDLLSEQEKQQVVEWNSTEAEYAAEQSVQEMFEGQVEVRPDAISVVFEDEHLTYGELNACANQLANHLRNLGVNPESRVAISVERSLDMVIGLLGILKAGGTYVPLDPSYPRERFQYTLQDSAVPILLTQEKLLHNFSDTDLQIICLDSDWETICGNYEENPPNRVLPENSAYVIYTSGSTGVPKGVIVQHRSLTNYIVSVVRGYEFSESDRLLQFSSPSFDTSAEEIYSTLVSGATLVLRTDSILGSSSEFIREIVRWGITILDLPTSFWHELAANLASGIEPWPAIRLVLIGGEAALYEPLVKWYEAAGEVWLVNAYGPTESTIVATQCSLTGNAGIAFDGKSVPIGKPVANVQTHILDKTLKPAPIGVIGELYVGGVGLARCYLNRPDTTAERFVPDHITGRTGGRLYRTGDRASYREDGNLEFLGRFDNQVKLRGYRIELAEIEAVLIEHPQIQQVAVACSEDNASQPRLVAYVVAKKKLGGDHLRQYLQSKLPLYMLPSMFVELDRMPLTTSGKIDRRSLPSPELKATHFLGPRNRVEGILCDVWAKLLGLEQVGITDNFFELGGDSILTIQIITRVREEGIHLTPRHFFQNQTIAELADVAELRALSQPEAEVTSGPVALTPIEHQFFGSDLNNPNHYNQSAMLEVKHGVESHLLEQAVDSVLLYHDAFRLRFERHRDQWLQSYADAAPVARFSRKDLSRLEQSKQRAAMQEDTARVKASLNLGEGVLVRVVEYDLGNSDKRLLLVIHHLVVDGVSWRILLEDIERAYEDLAAGRVVKLPAKTSSLRSWAQRLWQYSREEELRQQEQYWLNPEWEQVCTRVPVDEEQEENTVGSARTLSVWLSEQETQVLMQDMPSVYHTQINDVLLTALGQAYRRWSGNEWILIDLEGHGREDIFEEIDVSRTVGWFTSVFPVRLRIASGDPGQTLKQVKEQLRAVPRRGIGYGVLRYLSGDKDVAQQLRNQPLAQISFNYLGQFDQLFRESRLFKPAAEGAGPASSAGETRQYLLEINGLIANGRIRVDWTYSQSKHRERTIRKLADRFTESLRELIRHCQSSEAGGYTPSDFPDAALSQDGLDRVIAQLGDGPPKKKRVEAIYPLSGIQQGMLFHSLYSPNSGTYVEQMSCRIQAELDVEAFRRAWQTIVDRHAILRTSFVWDPVDEPLQVVSEAISLDWKLEDWRELTLAEQSQALRQFLENDRDNGFDFRRPSLMRVTLLRFGEHGYYMVWTCHHVLLDGWCQQVLIEELFICYEQYTRGNEAALDRPRLYRDYIRWLKRQDMKKAESFWREELRGITAPTPLVWDAGTTSAQERESRELEIELDLVETCAIEELAKRLQLTVNTIVEAAWALVLNRHSGHSDVVFGETVSGRAASLKGIERMVGPLINTLPVRVQVKGDETVRSYLKRVQERQGRAVEFDYSPLMQVQGWSEMGRGARLFDSLYVFENYPMDGGIGERAKAAMMHISEVKNYSRTNYPLLLLVSPGRRLHIKMVYADGRMEANRIRQVLEQMKDLLKAMASDSDQHVGNLSLLGEAHIQQLLIEWNDTTFQYDQTACMHELFQKQARLTPDAVAVVSQEGRICYEELNRRANQLAHYLRLRGVGAEVLVGILLGRTLDMVIALLGVLKSGGAYLALDAGYPHDRLRYMLDDAGVELLLTTQSYAAIARELPSEKICLDSTWGVISEQSDYNPEAFGDGDNLAYVIYTSGSTGRPKGVGIPHGSATAFLCWAHEKYPTSCLNGVLGSTSICFDLSIYEVYLPLSFGGRVILAENALALTKLEESLEVSLINTVPSAAQGLLKNEGIPDGVRIVNLAGEALGPELVERIYRNSAVEEVNNLYGPTETTTYSTFEKIAREGEWKSTIGRPIANTQLYILGQMGEAVPMGAAGDLYIGGAGLARGYINRAEATAERFLPNPYAEKEGARIYQTGDRGRYRGDGRIEYLGRMDNQVKVRGYRIELGEIEAVLMEREGVKQCAVVVREEEGKGKQLVCYYVGEGEAVSSKEMKRQVSERLPEYMVPAVFVQMEKLPLTANGKLDRQALPAPAIGIEASAHEQAPRNAVEETLCGIWAERLRLQKIGIHDNFFELGGDSILSIQIVGEAQRAGISITPRQIFLHPTIAELAEVVGTSKRLEAAQGMLSGPVPLTPVQARFFQQHRLDRHHYNQSVLLECAGDIDPQTVEAAVAALMRHHDALRTRFFWESGQWRQEIVEQIEAGVVKWVDLSGLDEDGEEQAYRQATAQLQASLELGEGRVLRVGYFERGLDKEVRLLVVAHHLVIDTVSWGVLLEDLEQIYRGLKGGEPVKLAQKTTSYKQWAEALEKYARSGDVEREQGEHWRETAREGNKMLPRELAGGENNGESGGTVVMGLSEEETERLVREVGKAYGSELQEVLLAGLVESVCEWSGERGAKVEVEGHGREEELVGADLTRSVGWFTSIYPVWLERVEAEGPRRQLERVRQQMRSVPQRGIGYGILRYLERETPTSAELDLGGGAEICFNYLGQFDAVLQQEGFFRPIGGEQGASRSPRDLREYTFEINCWISRGRFQAAWAYSRNLHRTETVEKLAQGYIDALRRLIVDSSIQQEQEPELSVSGFDPHELDSILAGIRVAPETTRS